MGGILRLLNVFQNSKNAKLGFSRGGGRSGDRCVWVGVGVGVSVSVGVGTGVGVGLGVGVGVGVGVGAWVYAEKCVREYVCVCVLCGNVCVRMCVFMRMCVHVCMNAYIHTCTNA